MPDATTPAATSRVRSKTVTAWLAFFLGMFGAHRHYLYGPRDIWAWLYWPFTLTGIVGVLRMRTLGQDDHLAWVLIPIGGLSISVAMLSAIVYGLTPDDRWAERHRRGAAVERTGWAPVLAVIASLMVGGAVLMGTLAFTGQKLFEWQAETAQTASAP